MLIQLELLFVRYGQVLGNGTGILGFRKDGSLYAEQGNFEEACQVARGPGVYAVQCENVHSKPGPVTFMLEFGRDRFSDTVGNKTGRVVIVCGVFYD